MSLICVRIIIFPHVYSVHYCDGRGHHSYVLLDSNTYMYTVCSCGSGATDFSYLAHLALLYGMHYILYGIVNAKM